MLPFLNPLRQWCAFLISPQTGSENLLDMKGMMWIGYFHVDWTRISICHTKLALIAFITQEADSSTSERYCTFSAPCMFDRWSKPCLDSTSTPPVRHPLKLELFSFTPNKLCGFCRKTNTFHVAVVATQVSRTPL